MILISQELGVEGVRNKAKAHIIEAIRATGADEAALSESLDLAKASLEQMERSDVIRREELELEIKRQEREIELKRLDLE